MFELFGRKPAYIAAQPHLGSPLERRVCSHEPRFGVHGSRAASFFPPWQSPICSVFRACNAGFEEDLAAPQFNLRKSTCLFTFYAAYNEFLGSPKIGPRSSLISRFILRTKRRQIQNHEISSVAKAPYRAFGSQAASFVLGQSRVFSCK